MTPGFTAEAETLQRFEAHLGRTLLFFAIGPMAHRSSAMRIRHIALLSLAPVLGGCMWSDVAPGVDPTGIKAIRLGMSMEDVIQELGMPLSVDAQLGVHSGECQRMSRSDIEPVPVQHLQQMNGWLDSTWSAAPCCAANQGEREARKSMLVYSRMVFEDGVSPMLWIHFNGQRQVTRVFAKINSRVPWIDDKGAYFLHEYPIRLPDGTAGTKRLYLCDDKLLQKHFSQ